MPHKGHRRHLCPRRLACLYRRWGPVGSWQGASVNLPAHLQQTSSDLSSRASTFYNFKPAKFRWNKRKNKNLQFWSILSIKLNQNELHWCDLEKEMGYHSKTSAIESCEWGAFKPHTCAEDLQRCEQTRVASEDGKAVFARVCVREAARPAGGVQPFASGKGRHDEVMVTVRGPRADIFLTRFCFFILILGPAYQIHQLCSVRGEMRAELQATEAGKKV